MKKILILISLCFTCLGDIFGQNGQNIELRFTKPTKLLTTEQVNLWKYGSKGSGTITSTELAITLKKPEPFIALSVAVEGLRIDPSALNITVLTKQNDTWAKEWQVVDYNHDADNSPQKFMSNMLELDKAVTAIKIRFSIQSNDTRLKKAKIRLFAPGYISTGSVNHLLQQRSDCTHPPPSVSRSVWGAQWNLTDNKIYKGTPTILPVTHLIVHHSAGNNTSSNWAAIVAAYFDLHVNTNGWSDIGYNWLVAPDGTLFVGRGGGDGVVGAHMCGYNANTMAVCLIGNYTSIEPSTAAIEKLNQVLTWKAASFGINPLGIGSIRSHTGSMNNISGHRDGCTPNYTECPGNLLYNKLSTIRQNVKNRLSNCTTSQTDIVDNMTWSVYPNPSNGHFFLSAQLNQISNSPLKVLIYNIEGKHIFEKKIKIYNTTINEQIELSNTPKGTYLIRLAYDNNISSRLISIQ